MTLQRVLTLVFALGTVIQSSGVLVASDWPQWQGPDRNGLSTESGLLTRWPATGPPTVWSASGLGGGYGSIAVAGDRIFVPGAKDRRSGLSVLRRADVTG